MATATAIEIKRAYEAAQQVEILAEINERLKRIESMCEQALELLQPRNLPTAELVSSVEFATKADMDRIIDLLSNPQTVIDHPVAPKRGRPITTG